MSELTTASIATVTALLVQYLAKKYFYKIKVLKDIPMVAWTVIMAASITAIGHASGFRSDANVLSLIFEVVIIALASTGIYELPKSSTTTLSRSASKSKVIVSEDTKCCR